MFTGISMYSSLKMYTHNYIFIYTGNMPIGYT